MVDVSFVIVNWNTRDELLGCLESLRANPPDVPWEAVVVDNASTDGSVNAVQERAPWARVIVNTKNRGLAPGNNQGLVASAGNVVVICNPDVEFQPGSIDALLETFQRRPRAGLVFARLQDLDGTVQTSAGALPTLRYALLGRARQPVVAEDPPHPAMWWDGWAHDSEMQVGHGLEACYAVRRAAVTEIGPQDERYVVDWEGLDWCDRAWRAGWEVWFCPSARVVHLGSRAIRKTRFRSVARSHMGMYRYFADRSHPLFRLILAPLLIVRALLKFAAMAVRRGYFSRYVDTDY